MAVVAPKTHGARRNAHPVPCATCGGKVITCPDPDENDEVGKVHDITYCVDCATIYSPWTMPYWGKAQEHRQKKKDEA